MAYSKSSAFMKCRQKKNPTVSILFQISNSWISISLKSIKKRNPLIILSAPSSLS